MEREKKEDESKDRHFGGRIGRTEISEEGAKVSKWNDIPDRTSSYGPTLEWVC